MDPEEIVAVIAVLEAAIGAALVAVVVEVAEAVAAAADGTAAAMVPRVEAPTVDLEDSLAQGMEAEEADAMHVTATADRANEAAAGVTDKRVVDQATQDAVEVVDEPEDAVAELNQLVPGGTCRTDWRRWATRSLVQCRSPSLAKAKTTATMLTRRTSAKCSTCVSLNRSSTTRSSATKARSSTKWNRPAFASRRLDAGDALADHGHEFAVRDSGPCAFAWRVCVKGQ